jgi:hypothetical protein
MEQLLPGKEIDDKGDNDAEQDAGCNGKINPYPPRPEMQVAGQTAQRKFVCEQKQHSHDNHNGACNDEKPSDIYPVHAISPV